MKHLEQLAMLEALSDMHVSKKAFEDLESSVKVSIEIETEKVCIKRTYEYFVRKSK